MHPSFEVVSFEIQYFFIQISYNAWLILFQSIFITANSIYLVTANSNNI